MTKSQHAFDLLFFNSLFVFVVTFAFSVSAVAQENDQSRWRFSQFQWENDDFFPQFSEGPGDRFYTNGLRLEWIKRTGNSSGVAPSEYPWWSRPVADRLCKNSNCTVTPRLAFGQNFFTPELIDVAEPQPLDRPWKGWLYSSFSTSISRSPISQHNFEIQFGVTGPAAGAEFVQREWHALDFVKATTPLGWDNQADNELGVNFFYDYQKIQSRKKLPRNFLFDVIPYARASMGTISTTLGGGIHLRVGKNISGFPYRNIRPTKFDVAKFSVQLENLEEPTEFVAPEISIADESDWEYYVFVGLEGRGVFYNNFIEGSLFENDPGVDPERFVWEFHSGARVRYKTCVITYVITRRGPEFKRPPASNSSIHNFSSLSISRSF